MFGKTMWSIYRKWIIIVLLAGCVYVFAYDSRATQDVVAAPCCESCPGFGDPVEGMYTCANECFLQYPGNTPAQQACYNQCMGCYISCIYCNSGGGPYGECTSTSECPINAFCGADNYCHPF